jgi:hypothetical protein
MLSTSPTAEAYEPKSWKQSTLDIDNDKWYCNRRMPEGSRRDHRYQNKGARDERIVG